MEIIAGITEIVFPYFIACIRIYNVINGMEYFYQNKWNHAYIMQ